LPILRICRGLATVSRPVCHKKEIIIQFIINFTRFFSCIYSEPPTNQNATHRLPRGRSICNRPSAATHYFRARCILPCTTHLFPFFGILCDFIVILRSSNQPPPAPQPPRNSTHIYGWKMSCDCVCAGYVLALKWKISGKLIHRILARNKEWIWTPGVRWP